MAPMDVTTTRTSASRSRRCFILTCGLFLILVGNVLLAQQAQVIRNVNLRPSASTAEAPIELLQPPATVTVLDPQPDSGYLHVRTAAGNDGWAWWLGVAFGQVSSIAS